VPDSEEACLAGVLGSCRAPCRGGRDAERHAEAVVALHTWMDTGAECDELRALRVRMAALAEAQRYEDAATARDQLEAVDTVRRAMARLRRARSRSGVLLAADLDDRFVQAFACARGLVVARRRLPRSGDAMLEIAPLVVALEAGLTGLPAVFEPEQAEAARIVGAAFARPGVHLRAVPFAGDGSPARAVSRMRHSVGLRR
jgi:DNA polymerase-3 subunit epsilon